MYSLHLHICNLSMASFSFPHACTWSHQPNSTPSALNYYTSKSHYLLLSLMPTKHLSNNALNLQLSYVLHFAYCDGCRIFDLVRDLECQWFRGEFVNFRWVLYNVFDRHGGASTYLQLWITDILTNRNRLLRFFAAQENHMTADDIFSLIWQKECVQSMIVWVQK